eukprot:CAMPEP_0198601446 /NCGR_PEP_ID=MMETSP1462-20131121/149536_1 /TAXON_ID=1333877 /ORGANISM="Brandtodinium nutriculum, Strain RCC3387" /LENGTH=45 /DNA_ID= /DNA_START= /DNA_END= /DNA_ORIENTATION=
MTSPSTDMDVTGPVATLVHLELGVMVASGCLYTSPSFSTAYMYAK